MSVDVTTTGWAVSERPVEQKQLEFDGMPVAGSRFSIRSTRKQFTEQNLRWKSPATALVQGRVAKVEYGEDGEENVRTHVIEVIEAQLSPKCPNCGEEL